MPNRKGNRLWGHFQISAKNPTLRQFIAPRICLQTEFEKQVITLHLADDELVQSDQLRRWARKHRNQRYIPEHLLKAWGLEVDTNTGSLLA